MILIVPTGRNVLICLRVLRHFRLFVRLCPLDTFTYAKIMQTESRDASLLASYAEVQLILCKDNANREQRCKLACKLCRGAAYLMQRYKMKNKKRFPHVGNSKPEFYIILNY